jgi:hypothetical protein
VIEPKLEKFRKAFADKVKWLYWVLSTEYWE